MKSNPLAGRPRPEPRNRVGEILLSHNHIALLNGVLDRPRGRAESPADWARAAVPYVRLFRHRPSEWLLQSATFTMHPSWVKHRRDGRRHVWTLTKRGFAILRLEVPSHIRCVGPYHGVSALRALAKAAKPEPVDTFNPHELSNRVWAAVDEWWEIVNRHPMHRNVPEWVNLMVNRWRVRSSSDAESWAADLHALKAYQLRRYICWFVMTNRMFPKGTHEIPSVPGVDSCGFEVDFDELGA